MKNKLLIFSTGFALFSMFFGSGNLVFPITVGKASEGHFVWAFLGIFLTGVLIPFLGVLGLFLYKGDFQRFFALFGKRGTFVFSFLALALLGPFGVLARCLTVAHGSLLLLWPDLSLPATSLCLCVVIYFLTMNKHQIINTLGNALTPVLLLAIGLIAYFGSRYGHFPEGSSFSAWSALQTGFFQGYQTMDLLAAFFFSQFVIKHLRNLGNEAAMQTFFPSALIASLILSCVYFALVTLGWLYSSQLMDTPPQKMLGKIALEALGPYGAPCVCVAVLLACLTTAIALTFLFADFLKEEVTQNRLGNKPALALTLGIGFAVSTFDFAGIASFLGPILETVYPVLILLTLFNLGSHLWRSGKQKLTLFKVGEK